MRSSKGPNQPILIPALIGIAGLTVGLGTLSLDLLPPIWAIPLVVTAFLLLLGSLFWDPLVRRLLHAIGHFLDHHPLAALIILFAVTAPALILSVISLQRVTDLEEAIVCGRSVKIRSEDTGVYNAAPDNPGAYPDGGRVQADYLSSPNPEAAPGETIAGFSYTMIPDRETHEAETSGAYITFYNDSVDISDFDALSFSIDGDKSEEAQEVDVAVKLVVDDPNLPAREREGVVRVSPSLQKLGHFLAGHWERITIDLGEFTLLPLLNPAEHVDRNKVNKIAFFVDNDIVDRSPGGTVRIKDISFEKRGSQGGCP